MGWKSTLKKVANVASLGSISGIEGLMHSGVGGSIVGTGLGAVFGGPLGAVIGGSIGGQFDTNRANAKAVEEQNALNYQMWQRQNEYNTPANQVQRLIAAGLNPNLFYSQGNVGNASSVSMGAKHYDYNFAQAIDKASVILQMRNLQAQNANLNAQTSNIQSQTRLRELEAAYQQIQVDYFKKYGRFPNQSIPSTVMQTLQDVTGISSHSIEAFREMLWHDVMKKVGSGFRERQDKGDIFSGSHSVK